MGLVLAFQTASRRSSSSASSSRRPASRAADILLFTGVRYERHDEGQAHSFPPPAPAVGSAPAS
ncbi:hypothetical protein ACFQ4O_11610 [Methylopila musalis]|uniref:Uncharacterized protein n=1 Tax=Methylopila musalis TaxID=1134781 RepID=A0ABW3Z9D7_9HYPH